jgi:ABC-type transporter lipoprotein component MlaA
MNRAFWGLNEGIAVWVLRPIGTGWRWLFPRPVRTALGNFFTNLLYPGRLINNLLQGKGGKAWTETERFAVNTTVGVLGFRDQATRWGIGRSKEDFGQTFAKWGWRDSTYFVIPFFGPSTVRDTLGFAGNLAVDPAFWFPPASQVRNVNRNSDEVEGLVQFLRTTYDPYELARLLYVLNRENDVEDYGFETEEDGATETLGAVFLKPRDPGFGRRGRTFRVVSPATGRELAYTVWPQEGPAPIVHIVPGLGGHRLGSSALALAEASFENGNSPVTISSIMNQEFIEGGLSANLPGFLPSDAHDVHVFLDAVDADLRERWPDRFTTSRIGGISMGAITTLFIAAAEADPENDLIEFETYFAINSPVSLRHGVEQLDAFYNAPLEYPPEERRERIDGIFRKTLDLAQGVLDPGDESLPFTSVEARFLIGLSFRNTIRDIIHQTQLANDMGVLKLDLQKARRTDAYREITQFSFMEYVYAFALPYWAERRDDITLDEAGAERLFELSDLRSIEDALAGNDKVIFASNRNDFLLRSEDIEWVTDLLDEDRVLFFERGGHLGNLNRDDVREALSELVRNAAEE